MRAEPEHRDQRECRHTDQHAHEQPQAFARTRGRQEEERQHETGGGLHPDRRDERAARGLVMRRGGSRVARVDGACRNRCAPGAPGRCIARRPAARSHRRRQGQRERQQKHRQRVVVVAADRQLQQHRVQADEGDGRAPRAAHASRGNAHQRDCAETRQRGERLQRPQFARQAQRREGVTQQREQRPVGGVLVGPAEEVVNRVGGGLRGEDGVRVQAVQRTQVRETDVAEHVLGDQRRPEQQDRVGEDDRQRKRPQRQRAHTEQHRHIATGHHQCERLEARGIDAQTKALEGPGHPVRPTAAARGHIQRGGVRGAGGYAEDAGEHREQAERAKDTEQSRRRGSGGFTPAPPTPASTPGGRRNNLS